ncbi:anaerobic ribonucleoside-triphosphate reductase [Desulforamulus hydrothermalis]|uniref:Anaerobic ribonucleoside-triphosphate reductase n=1 Tax=Desulforamulus hydrothermalis Lam5 = DSM 18033 TaxID=1121428 RepID=K8E031_9FIRM|nr:anaerobic ribonucleoside-triphosphate reductase [Desulforamulus hydrothermalis]CCO08745.1 Anaerobic ribonucleoside-triphosphate reductase [Desulforamulus hydrothermalis Lam5 = DSM 18033]SHG70498.1 ribonucleoside-triphosphate reductase class III catalytic subunit [Desulforamulus hydrothermalis Lam5 = DSM 18033]
MFTKIRKRDGREVAFDETKITDAIFKAAKAVGGEDRQTAMELTLEVLKLLKKQYNGHIFGVEEVQDMVEKVLIETGHARTAKAYILYRHQRTRLREAKSDLMDAVEEILAETNRENANVSNSPSAKMLQIASAASKKYYLTRLIPEEMSQAHVRGDIHIHDLEFYGKTLTCIQIPLGRLLKEGFNTGHGYIRPPKRPTSATALAAIILQSSQNDMHGGQSFAFFDRDLAPFVEDASDHETYQAMEALIYNLNSMHSRAGAQVPFSSLNLGTETSEAARKVTRNLLLAYEAGLGRGENPIFPNIIFKLKEGINLNPGDPNYDLFQLAIRVSSKRLNPTFSFMDSSFNNEYGDQVGYMGCRTRVIANRRGPAVTDGRGNLSFTTINLPRLAIKAERNLDKFYRLLDEVMDLACRQLYHRFRVQAKLKVKDMPFVMGQGLYLGSQGLKPDDVIEDVIKHGTLSPGFIGLAEALVALTGRHHAHSEEAQALGLEIVSYLRRKVDEAAEQYNLNYTLLATPAESVAGRFAKLDRKEFGIIPGVTDKDYYTNSFHVPVGYPIGIFEKISLEGPYHKFCNAGHISYIEMASPPLHNPQAVEAIIKHMRASDMGYAAINFPVDYCTSCNITGVINQDSCPRCASPEIRRVRRITGYLSTVDRFNDAKVSELKDRVVHSGMDGRG